MPNEIIATFYDEIKHVARPMKKKRKKGIYEISILVSVYILVVMGSSVGSHAPLKKLLITSMGTKQKEGDKVAKYALGHLKESLRS